MADLREQARKAGKAAAPLGHNRETAAAGADAASDVWEEAWRRSVDTCDLELFMENERLRALIERAANEGRNVAPDATDNEAAAIEAFARLLLDPEVSSPNAAAQPSTGTEGDGSDG